MAESDAEYFGRRRRERDAKGVAMMQEGQERQRQWQLQLDALVEQFDSRMKPLLAAFAEEAPEVAEHQVLGPETMGRQINWWIEYTRGDRSPKKTILVVLRYLPGEDGSGQFRPDCFSVEGLRGVTTVRPPSIEALREALGNSEFRS